MPRSNNWFDVECKDKRNAFNRARRRYRDNKSEENLNQMRLAGKYYKVIINKAKAAEKHKFIQELRAKETKDPKSFWQIINTNSNKIKKTGNVTIEDFLDHFSELNSVVEIDEGQTEDSPTSNETLTCNCITDKYSDMLNYPFSEDEVKKAVKRLKNGKACGEDKILNEMIKAFSESHMSVLTKIFNIVLLSGHMPHEWVIGIVKPIYTNKGDINDPDNYRGITLLGCFGKLFTSILNDRLTTYINLNEMMSEAQAGFRKGYSTTDQLFTLKCIVELFLCQGRRLFCTFVDYSKAFDSINRATLWKKLISYGITGKVIDVIMNMYKSIKSCVMDSGIQSDFFASHVGVRQGENLSPLLFALFLIDLDTFFTKQKWDTLDYIDKLYSDCKNNVSRMLNLFVLLYADDTVIMAENECGMQRNLNLLNEYCNCNGLRVNIRKTKIMVFARSKTRLRNLPTFKFGNLDLDLVDDYVYLGICFNWNGSFVKAKKLLHVKASKAMYSLIQKVGG